jgi:hypothetical protein
MVESITVITLLLSALERIQGKRVIIFMKSIR